MKNTSYSIFKLHGAWHVRWSEYGPDGKRRQPSHKLGSVEQYPKESEVKDLAMEYMTKTVRKAQTVTAGGTVKAFVDGEFLPRIEKGLAKSTVALYRQAWNRLEQHLGHIRLRDVHVPDVQAALDAIHAERGQTIGHDIYMQCKVTCSAIFAHALRLGHTLARILRTALRCGALATPTTGKTAPIR